MNIFFRIQLLGILIKTFPRQKEFLLLNPKVGDVEGFQLPYQNIIHIMMEIMNVLYLTAVPPGKIDISVTNLLRVRIRGRITTTLY